MWTRSELKTKAKADFKVCYWRSVLVSFILSICIGGSGSSSGSSSSQSKEELQNVFSNMDASQIMLIISIVLAAIGIALVIGIALKVFVFNPLSIGAYKFFVDGTDEKGAELSVLGFGFKNNYKNQVLVNFMKNLFIFLWSLLLVIPGIVKAYEYRMVPYILGDNPDMNYKEALETSKKMMDGQKWNAFVLDLSFILWYLLSALTLGILLIFYVGPYVNFTNAELYVALKNEQ